MADKNSWLLFFYTVPSKPVSKRMTVWRKLLRHGALPFKGSVYLLPWSADHLEFFNWLTAEVETMGGEAAVAATTRIETMAEEELQALFRRARHDEYLKIEKQVDELSRKWEAIKKSGRGDRPAALRRQLLRTEKNLGEIRRIDFFPAADGAALEKRLQALRGELGSWQPATVAAPGAADIAPKKAADYQRRTWATRRRPFVDRMASAWLIRRFIDPKADFVFANQEELHLLPDGVVLFDVPGAEFTHAGDLCTFEVLLKSFTLKERALRQLAEIVHALDLKDERYQVPEAEGVESILQGIRKTAASDREGLERGMQVFEMLYLARK